MVVRYGVGKHTHYVSSTSLAQADALQGVEAMGHRPVSMTSDSRRGHVRIDEAASSGAYLRLIKRPFLKRPST